MSESLYFGLKQLPPGEVGPDDKDVIDRYAGRIAEPIPAPIEVGISSSINISDEYHAEIVPSPIDDNPAASDHTKPMTEITRDELNAKLEALESRMDARVGAIGGKIDAFLAAQVERDKASEYRFGRIEGDLSSIKSDLKSTSSDVHEVRRTLAKYMGGISVGAAIAGLVIGAALKHFF